MSTTFALLVAVATAVGLLGVVAWGWSGFDGQVAVLLVAAVVLAWLGCIGFMQACNGDRTRAVLGAYAAVFALGWVMVGVLS